MTKFKTPVLFALLATSAYCQAQGYDKEFLKDFAKEMNKTESEMLQRMTIKAKNENLTINQAMWDSCNFLTKTAGKKIDCKRIEGK